MASTVPIAVEKLLEKEVQEISRDGQETYAPQLSMSEKLAQLAHKIDFSKPSCDNGTEEDSSEDKSDKPLFQPSLWPWDSVRDKLRNTLTNLCVLTDVLSVTHDKKYLSLDPVSQGEAPPKPTLRLLTKRKNFSEASRILLQGVQEMSGGLKDQHENMSQKDFHSELMSLRQRWRLKRSGNLILGDLSYKSAGSKFWHTGAFEVKKQSSPGESDNLNSIDVNISSDLNGLSEVQVRILDNDKNMDGSLPSPTNISLLSFPETVNEWHRKLCISQNNLFCKELFAQTKSKPELFASFACGDFDQGERLPDIYQTAKLAHESYHSKGVSTQVVGNVVETEIFPATKMRVTFAHKTEEECEDDMNVDGTMGLDVLDFSLQTLLRQQHRASCSYETPRPVTSGIPVISGIAMKDNKKRRVAGPCSMTAQDFEELSKSQRLLEKLINIAKHHILAKRVCRVVHDLAEDIHDPLLSCHWSSLSTETSSFATIYIGLKNRAERTCLAMKVNTDTVHITQQDGTGMTLSADTQELKMLLRKQIQLFILQISKKIGMRLGWIVKHNDFLSPTRDSSEIKEHLIGILLSCPEKEREVFIEVSPPSIIKIKVKSPQYNDPLPEILENEPKWATISRNYHHLNYKKIPGRTVWDKLSIVLQAS